MPQYAVSFRRSAEKELRRLDAGVRNRVLHAIRALAANPRPPGCRKLVGGENAFRIRVGDYRVVYSVDDVVLVIFIERTRHRRDAYR